tara:strand:- start:27 stop:299 length:273 start_codon:yes stop_codon:yes gene_type:complete
MASSTPWPVSTEVRTSGAHGIILRSVSTWVRVRVRVRVRVSPQDHSEVVLHLKFEGLPLLVAQQVALIAHEDTALRLLAHLVRDGLVLLG